MDSNKRIARNTFLLTVRMVFVMIISLYTSRVILNTLGVVDYGIYNVVAGFVSMFSFLNSSLANGIQRFYNYEIGSKGNQSIGDVYVTSLQIQIILAVLLVLVLETVGLWYVNNKMVIPEDRFSVAVWVYHMAVLSLVFVVLQIPYSAVILAHERMDYYAVVSIIDVVLKLGIAIILPFVSSDKLLYYGILISMISILDFCLYFVYAKHQFSALKYKHVFHLELMKSMLGFSGWNVFGTFASMCKEQGLNMVLNLFYGPVVNAARGISYQVSSAVQSFVSSVGVSIRPQLIQSYASGDYSRSKSLMFSFSKIGFIILYVISLPLMAEINYVLCLWLGDTVPNHTASFVRIIFLINYINTLNGAVSAVIHASGKMALYQMAGSIISIVVLPVSYVQLTNGASPESVFYATLIITAIGHCISLVIMHHVVSFPILEYCSKVLYPILMIIIFSFWIPIAVKMILPEGLLRLFISIILSSVAIILLTVSLGMDKKEKQILKNILNKYFKRS